MAIGTAKMALTIQMMRMSTFVQDFEAWLLRGNMMALYRSTAMAVSVKILAFTLRFCKNIIIICKSNNHYSTSIPERRDRMGKRILAGSTFGEELPGIGMGWQTVRL